MSQRRLSELVILPVENKILVEVEHKNISSINLASQKERKIDFEMKKLSKYKCYSIKV